MNRTNQPYLLLSLLMLVVVMVAAYFFLFRSWGQVAERANAVDSIDATRTAAEAELATAVSDVAALETQLLDSQRVVDTLNADLTQAQETLAQFAAESDDESTRLLIASPQNGAELTADTAVEVIIVAIDAAGIASLDIDLNGEARRLPVNDAPVHIARELWTPTTSGAAELSVTATNSNGRVSNPTTVSVSVNPAPPPQVEAPAQVPVAIAAATATAADSFTAGEAIDLIIFVSDPAGITAASVSIGDEAVESFVADGETVRVYRTAWTPTAAGDFVVSVSLQNVNGTTTTRDTFTISVTE